MSGFIQPPLVELTLSDLVLGDVEGVGRKDGSEWHSFFYILAGSEDPSQCKFTCR